MTRISCYRTPEAANAAVSELQKHHVTATTATEEGPDRSTLTVLEVDSANRTNAIPFVRGNSLKAVTILCPDCGSAHIVYPNQPKASPTAAVVEKIAETRHLTDRTFFCRACQHEWSSQVVSS